MKKMKKMKKCFILLLTILLLASMPFTVFADTTTESPNGTPATKIQTEGSSAPSLYVVDTITPVFIRQSDDSTVVQVYLKYSGSGLVNAIKFTEFTVQNTNLIFQKTYGSIPPGTYETTASTFFELYLGDIDIPTDVDKVRVQDSGLQAYYLLDGWMSFTNIIGIWSIE